MSTSRRKCEAMLGWWKDQPGGSMYHSYFYTKFWGEKIERAFIENNAPEELYLFMDHIHEELFAAWSNDWIYEIARTAFRDYELGEFTFENVPIEPDYYSEKLRGWLLNDFSVDFVDRAIKRCPGAGNLMGWVRIAQEDAKERIYELVWEFLQSKKTSS